MLKKYWKKIRQIDWKFIEIHSVAIGEQDIGCLKWKIVFLSINLYQVWF